VQGPIYSIDINSAYPHAIAKLPSLSDGKWEHVEADEILSRLASGDKLPSFGLWKVRLADRNKGGFAHQPSPLFHRDLDGNVSFPWHTIGWYFSHEAYLAFQHGAEILEGWFYQGSGERPFSWIRDMYQTRREWKSRGIPAQLALKLCMNSIYGKLAQRVGWDEQKQRIPPWHQLEWAGWVTSYTRAMLFAVIRRIPYEHLVAVETDGIYTTYHPSLLGIENDTRLGGWEVTEYREMMYVQSGMAWLQTADGRWVAKRRGLDADSFTLADCKQYLPRLVPGKDWPAFTGHTTRFVGLGQALQSSQSLLDTHCVWETRPRDINPGSTGKRVHVHRLCRACANGANAYEQPHDLVIRSMSTLDPRSYPHDIPWEQQFTRRAWKDSREALDDSIFQELIL
jgi:DNA polymerase type B, organellar and viral